MLAEHGCDSFAEAFLRDGGLHWAADVIAGAPHGVLEDQDRVDPS